MASTIQQTFLLYSKKKDCIVRACGFLSFDKHELENQ